MFKYYRYMQHAIWYCDNIHVKANLIAAFRIFLVGGYFNQVVKECDLTDKQKRQIKNQIVAASTYYLLETLDLIDQIGTRIDSRGPRAEVSSLSENSSHATELTSSKEQKKNKNPANNDRKQKEKKAKASRSDYVWHDSSEDDSA